MIYLGSNNKIYKVEEKSTKNIKAIKVISKKLIPNEEEFLRMKNNEINFIL